jgi:hypothetical protein
MLAKHPEPTVANGITILKACLFPQDGAYATKYSNIYDLKSGDIYIFPFYERLEQVKLNLAVELKKGAHYYDIPHIGQQLSQPPLPLLYSMKRLSLDKLQPISDREPIVTKHLCAILRDMFKGNLQPDDYSADLWKEFYPKQNEIKTDLKRLGGLISMTLVERWDEEGLRHYRYRTEFANATVLQHYVMDKQNKVVLIRSDDIEIRSNTAVKVN